MALHGTSSRLHPVAQASQTCFQSANSSNIVPGCLFTHWFGSSSCFQRRVPFQDFPNDVRSGSTAWWHALRPSAPSWRWPWRMVPQRMAWCTCPRSRTGNGAKPLTMGNGGLTIGKCDFNWGLSWCIGLEINIHGHHQLELITKK